MSQQVKVYFYFFFVICIWAQGCSKGGNSTPTPTTTASPAKATLVAPAQNAVCTTGTVISTTQSSITFNWQASANTDNYSVAVKNLLTNAVTQQQATTNSITVTLTRGTPYSWSVTSNGTGNSAQSDVWKFYNAGLGVTNYAPFPADLTSPTFGQSVTAIGGTVNLTWTGSDTDNDIVGYDVYFGTTTSPAVYKSGLTASSVASPTVASGTTYYWKVITNDSKGNSSASDLFQFTVK